MKSTIEEIRARLESRRPLSRTERERLCLAARGVVAEAERVARAAEELWHRAAMSHACDEYCRDECASKETNDE